MSKKSVEQIVESTLISLRKELKHKVKQKGGKSSFANCAYPARTFEDELVLNVFDEIYIKDDVLVVKYHDEYGNYEDPIMHFSVDDLVEMYYGL